MPSLPDIPGKDLVGGSSRRFGKEALGAGMAMIVVGGYAARRLVRRMSGGGGEDAGASADPIAETPTAPPGAERKPVPETAQDKAEPKAEKVEPGAEQRDD
jgi:hypothetical protein